MGSDGGLGLILILLVVVGIAFYLLPAIIAFARHHEYRWVILALTIIGGWTGICWIIALVWSVFPHNRSAIDPVVGPVTGIGYRNAGDTIGAAQFGQQRGYEQEGRRKEPQLGGWAQTPRVSVPSTAPAVPDFHFNDTVEALEKLERLRQSGALSADEFEAAKRRVLGSR